MAAKETSLPPKVRKSWLKSGIETNPPADDNVDLAKHSWCPEVVEVMAKYGQTPADLVLSDDEDEIEIQDPDVHYQKWVVCPKRGGVGFFQNLKVSKVRFSCHLRFFSNMERPPGYGQQYRSEQCIYCEFRVMGPEFA